MGERLTELAFLVPALLFALVIHEYDHGLVVLRRSFAFCDMMGNLLNSPFEDSIGESLRIIGSLHQPLVQRYIAKNIANT